MEQKYFSLKDTAVYLGLSEKILYKWATSKTIPAYKLGRVWRFDRTELDSYLRKSYYSRSSESAVGLGQGGH